ncbi:MAG: serine--tRNA ligase [Rhizobiales bacterium]|nr:serine--tRNA ligase [Hyphomicrobiales bacterium]MBO6698397.1 serine--tRNA ligase [Hyphomicrobiales bacterium]MBO6735349.1 serine--tRNA ligase [Hyphomicrobiales bacterium]MBO6910843.1 serine--tRNA ligase [Hyphomicrobiales bacterium]MBO6955899.1 serine--tRNA ligase [Hyphomicrobiales bacterium]
MLDIRLIRDNPATLDEALKRRGAEPASADVLKLDDARREHLSKLQEAQNARNTASKAIGKAKATGDEAEAARLIEEVAKHKAFIQSGEVEERRLTEALDEALAGLPNIPLDDVPVGTDEDDNVEIRQAGSKAVLNFAPKEHFEIGEAMGLMDFETAAKLSGSRFCVMKGALAKLERALGQFMLNTQTGKNGYQEIAPPLLVRDEVMFGTGQLPKFADDLFRTAKDEEESDQASTLWMVPTAEVPLTNLVRESIVDAESLPHRYTALTPCFRAEAGSAGRDTRGYIRQHQFNKVEMVSITVPEESDGELERMTGCAEAVLADLGLHTRTVVLCTGDMGFGAQKTYDIEVWLPGQGRYREISSCSTCGDFQARRMQARYRDENGKPQFVHTLNGSGVATGRALIAVMETYQTEEGGVRIPEVLVPYMGGTTLITADGKEVS